MCWSVGVLSRLGSVGRDFYFHHTAGGLCANPAPDAENPMCEPVPPSLRGGATPCSVPPFPGLARALFPSPPGLEAPQEAGDESCLG